MSRRPLLLAALLLLLAPAAPADAAPGTTWLCKPGLANDPCRVSLTATVTRADGSSAVERTRRPRRPPVDCFYVYPTVSSQRRTNATLAVDPEQRAIAEQQAARFSATCRVFAPVYRQLTLEAIGRTPPPGRAAFRTAYAGVRDAWREYLRRDNDGRGVVLVGHSQGTGMLTELVRQEIDAKPAIRRRLVSALLIGGNVAVRRGSDRGGDFRNVRACRRPSQTGCVVAYSMFAEDPPADTRFGQVNDRFVDHADDAQLEVLCTNPAALSGGSGLLDTYGRVAPFPGPLGLVVPRLPPVATPWLRQPGLYTARCRHRAGTTWLSIGAATGPEDPRPRVTQTLGPTWGLHLVDVNLALGNLTSLVRRQAAAYGRR